MKDINDSNIRIETRLFMHHIEEKNRYKKQRNVFIGLCLFFMFIQLLSFIFFDFHLEHEKSMKQDSIVETQIDYAEYFNTHLDYVDYKKNKYLCYIDLMKSEDFKESEYICPANCKTIGFGHQITAKDKIPKNINFAMAYDLLVDDFEQAILYAKNIGYEKNNNKQLAVAHAIYCMGIGKVKSIKNFENDILKYVFYKDNKGKYVKSSNLTKNRSFEYELYRK